MSKETYEEKLEKRGRAVLEIMKSGVGYGLEILREMAKAKIRGIFAAVDLEFNEVIVHLFQKERLLIQTQGNPSYVIQGFNNQDPKASILFITKVISVIKID